MYEEVEKILDLCWKDDDRMEQTTLYEVQERVADLLLNIAYKEGRAKECLKKYEWIYKAWYSWDEEK